MSGDFHEIEVVDVIDETADSRSLVLRVPEPLRERFAYRAGQFLTFEIPWEGFAARRCYSLASAPAIDAAPKVTVKRVAGGRVSNWIHDHVRPGDVLRVRPPEGQFVLDARAGEADLTLFAGGSGITPMMSLLKTALATTPRHVKMVYANRDAASIIFAAELDALAAAHAGRFALHHHLDGEAGFLTSEQAHAHISGREAGEFYVCGPGPFMELVEAALAAAKVPGERVCFERFASLPDPDRREAARQEELDRGGPADADADVVDVPESFIIRLSGRTHTVPYQRGLTLLACARQAGVDPPSSCEDGFCGSCMAKLVEGDLRMRSHEALSAREVEQGKVLLCQARPTSAAPLTIDFDASSFKIEGRREGRALPTLVGFLVFAFVAAAVWILRTTG